MPQSFTTKFVRRVLIACWLVAGLACVLLDETIQPTLTVYGRQPAVHWIAVYWQDLGAAPGILLFLMVGLAASFVEHGYTFVRFAACVSSAGVAAQLIKYTVGRARPHSIDDTTRFLGPFGVLNFGDPLPIDSMPSGHTAAAFAMAAALAFRWPASGWICYPLAVGVGMSRTLVDRHFPSDVILGALVGIVITTVIWNLFDRLAPASRAT